MDLKDKNVIYIGGFGGIGQKCLQTFLKREIKNLIVCDLHDNKEVLRSLRDSYSYSNIFYIPIDVTKNESIEEAYKLAAKKVNKFDVVVNGCGLMNDSFIDLTIDINLKGVIHSTLKALEYMDASKGGRGGVIANISSVAGLQPNGMFAIYSAAKCGLTAFTCSLAYPLYYKYTGISLITLCPGFTDTTLLDSVRGKETLTEYAEPLAVAFAKVKRQTPEICAEMIVKAVEISKNGNVWMLDNGEMTEIEFKTFWKPKLNTQ
uniref:Alcohol dehydrogenase 1 n=1 Tax=Glossina morsitans morsitans TaxID=37546 RepID=D3TR41_GLOMM